MYAPDNYDRFKQHEAAQEAELQNRPECDYCGYTVQDDFCYVINGDIVCDDCIKDFRRAVEEL